MSVHQKKNGKWIAVYYDEERKQRSKTFGLGDEGRLRADIFDQEMKRSKGKLKLDGPSVASICNAYHADHPVQDTTHQGDNYKLNKILALLGNLQADLLGTKELNQYVKKRLRDGVKRKTVQRELQLLKAAFAWAISQDPPLLVRNMVAFYKLKAVEEPNVPTPPTPEEVRKIIDTAEPHFVRALYLYWNTGMRPGRVEMFSLKWADVSWSYNTIRITSARKGGPTWRDVPITEEFKEILQLWYEEDKRFVKDDPKKRGGADVALLPVVHYWGKPCKSMKRAWETAKQRANITRRLRMYDLRHAFATVTLQNGADLKSVSQLIGHSRPDTTLRAYQHVPRKLHREAIALVPSLGQYPDNTPASRPSKGLKSGKKKGGN